MEATPRQSAEEFAHSQHGQIDGKEGDEDGAGHDHEGNQQGLLAPESIHTVSANGQTRQLEGSSYSVKLNMALHTYPYTTDLTDDGRVGEPTLPSGSDLSHAVLRGTKALDELLLTVERSDLQG